MSLIYAPLPFPILIQPSLSLFRYSQTLSIPISCLKEIWSPFIIYNHHKVVCVFWKLPIKSTLFTFPRPAPWADMYFRLNLVLYKLIMSFWLQITFLCFLMAEVSSNESSPSFGFPLRTFCSSLILVTWPVSWAAAASHLDSCWRLELFSSVVTDHLVICLAEGPSSHWHLSLGYIDLIVMSSWYI